MTYDEWLRAGGVARHLHDFQRGAVLVVDGDARCTVNADVYDCACGERRIVAPRGHPDDPGALSVLPNMTGNAPHALIDASRRTERHGFGTLTSG